MPGCTAVFDAHDTLTRQCRIVDCYQCNRGFCVACQSPWHPGICCYSTPSPSKITDFFL